MTSSRQLARILNLLGPFLGLMIVIGIFAWLSHRPGEPLAYLSAENIKKVAVQTAILALCGVGMTLVIVSGGIDLSIGSIVALANVTVVLVLNGEFFETIHSSVFRNNTSLAWGSAATLSVVVAGLIYARSRSVVAALGWVGVSWLAGWLVFDGHGGVAAFCAGTLIGLICGWINGLLVTSTGVVPFIITLGTMEAYRGFVQLIARESKVTLTPESVASLRGENATNAWISELTTETPRPEWLVVGTGVWLLVIAAVLAIVLLSRLRLGRYIFAIGSNEEAGRLSGLAIPHIKRWVYGLSGLAAGLAGVLTFSRIQTGAPEEATGLELEVIAAVVIGGGSLRGGEGSIIGTLIGAFILGFMRNGCTLAEIPTPVQHILIGVIIVLAVALDEWRHKRRS